MRTFLISLCVLTNHLVSMFHLFAVKQPTPHRRAV
uniref:Uncharacterized protein n=1 Tax=Setaria viridis TaxID=4556 RepID=A0A4U6V8J9_SETVI|nr:hypothetical protein SEVIR_3G129666v2 [Setaria viridis]